MDRIDGINPKRLQWCLDDAHVSLRQLATDVGVSYAALQDAIDGKAGLTFIQLKKVGEYFGRTALFFLEEGAVNEAEVRSKEFRTLLNHRAELNSTIKKVIRLAEWQREVFIDLVEEIGVSEEYKFIPPKLQSAPPSVAAAKAREWLNLKKPSSFSDYRDAMERAGILVFRTNGYAGKWQIPKESSILGFSLYDNRHPLIVVKKQGNEARQTFTMAHELGHLLLHRSSMIDDEHDLHSHKGKEAAANSFAGHFLVPDNYLKQISDDRRPDNAFEYDAWLSDQRAAWGVSTEVILLRLLEAGRLERDAYASYRAWMQNQKYEEKDGGNRSYRHREPRHILGDRYVRVVFEALDRNKISLTKASKYLDDIKLSDIRELERYCASH